MAAKLRLHVLVYGMTGEESGEGGTSSEDTPKAL